MRRPPDKAPASTAERDVGLSNATLKTVFGGARQKPWMTTGPPVRPTPRPASKSSLPATLPHQTATAVLPSPSPSEGPSPSLSHNEVPQRNDENENPAADDDQYYDIAGWDSPVHSTAQTIQTPPAMEIESGPPHLQAIPPQPPQPPQDHHPSAPIQNWEIPSTVNAPGPQIQQQNGQRPPSQNIQYSTHTEPRTESQRPAPVAAPLQHTVPPLHTEAPVPRPEYRGQPPSPIRISSSSPESSYGNTTPIGIPDQPQLQPGGQRVPFPSSLLPSQTPQPQPQSAEANVPLNTHQHQRARSPVMAPLRSMISTIRAHISNAGGAENLNSNLERPRFQLLIDACDGQDIFYVVLHQLFCLWDYDRSQLLSSPLLPGTDVLQAAFAIIGQLIRDNQGMAPNHLRWFSNFPEPLNSLLTTFEVYRQVVGDVGKFLRKLASQWDVFSKQCRSRNYPPLVHELVNHLGILSPILHGVTFTATRRNLGIQDDPAIEEIFAEDKRGYQEHSNRFIAGQPPGQDETSKRNQDLANRYYTIAIQQAQRGTQSQGPAQRADRSLFQPPMVSNVPQPPTAPNVIPSQASNTSSRPPTASNVSRPLMASNVVPSQAGIPLSRPPMAPNNVPSQAGIPLSRPPMAPNNVPSQAASPLSRPPMAPNNAPPHPPTFGPEPTRLQNLNSQSPRFARRTTAGPSNPSPVAGTGQPVGMTGQPSYAEVPSPTFFENLYIQSPVTGSATLPPATPSSISPSPVQQGPQWASPAMGNNISYQQRMNPPVDSAQRPDRAPMSNQSPGTETMNTMMRHDAIHRQHMAAMAAHQQHQQQMAAIAKQQQHVPAISAHQQQHVPALSPQQVLNIQAQQAQQQHTGPLQQQQVLNPQTQQSQPNTGAVQAHRQQMLQHMLQTHYMMATHQQQPQRLSGPQPQPAQHGRPQQPHVPQQRPQPQAARPGPLLRGNSTPQTWSQTLNSSNPHSPAIGGVTPPAPQSHNPATRRSATSVETMLHLTQPLIPPAGYMHPPQPIDPDLTALHQAHVRSPRLVAAKITQQAKTPAGDISQRFYQFVQGFALPPSKIRPTASVSAFGFTISEQDLSLVAEDKWPSATDPLATREFKQGTLQYRLRCTRSKNDIEQDVARRLTSEWVISDTTWPEMVFIQINGEDLDIRRKNHHGKDLPIDVTRHIRAVTPGHGSINHVKISTPRSSKSKDDAVYFLAVEVVEILQHSQVMDMVNQQHIPVSETLNSIKKSLAGPTVDDDDDFAMVVSDLSVDLADPFTARIFDIPVRGNACLHRECFDLSAFLQTRDSKPKHPGQPCMVDVWKCPLCGRDARPCSLRIDEYFVAVRAKLAADGALDVKSIWISADGSWRPKADTLLKRKASSAIPDDDDDEEEGAAWKQIILDRAAASRAASRAASMEAGRGSRSATQAVEIIELDDD